MEDDLHDFYVDLCYPVIDVSNYLEYASNLLDKWLEIGPECKPKLMVTPEEVWVTLSVKAKNLFYVLELVTEHYDYGNPTALEVALETKDE